MTPPRQPADSVPSRLAGPASGRSPMRLDALDAGSPSGVDAAAVERAAAALAAGELVAFPTETVYGFGARADDDAAVAHIFTAKGRPSGHPLIVHVADAASAGLFTPALPEPARRLTEAFWPGPLTVIVPRRPGIAAAAAAGQATVGLRCPAHPVAQALLRAAAARGVAGVAAPSANRFGKVSPTQARHVEQAFGDTLLVLDGGDCEVGIESAIVDCSRGRPVLLRPGQLSADAIEAALGMPLHRPPNGAQEADAPRAPGTLAAHYAPVARLRLMPAAELHTALQTLGNTAAGLAVYSRTALPPGLPAPGTLHRRMPSGAAGAARELFAALRGFDEHGARLIWVEQPPAGAEWDGVRDRLQRAAAAAP